MTHSLNPVVKDENLKSKGSIDISTCLPDITQRKLMKHQLQGVEFMYNHLIQDQGCILADFMGLGKTLQVVALCDALMNHTKNPITHALIVVPLSVVDHWKEEFKKYDDWQTGLKPKLAPTIQTMTSQVAPSTREKMITKYKESPKRILLISYDMYRSLIVQHESTDLANVPNLVILDEGHAIKNYKSLKTAAIYEIKTKKRLVLTGYPLQNNLFEYFTIVQFVKKNALGSFPEFQSSFMMPITRGLHSKDEEEIKYGRRRAYSLFKLMSGFMIRRNISILKDKLKPKYEFIIKSFPSKIQFEMFRRLIILTTTTVHKVFWINNISTLIANHPDILFRYFVRKKEKKDTKEQYLKIVEHVIGDYKPTFDLNLSTKMKFVVNMLENLRLSKEKLVLFSRSLETLDFIEQLIKSDSVEFPVDYLRFDGDTRLKQRQQYVHQFNNDPSINLFLVSTKAGGEGLNLSSACRCVILDVNFNPSYDLEACCRIYRIGQQRPVHIYRMSTQFSIEEVVMDRQFKKEQLANWVVDDIATEIFIDKLKHKIKLRLPSIEEYREEKLKCIRNTAVPLDLEPDVVRFIEENHGMIRSINSHDSLIQEATMFELSPSEIKLAERELFKSNIYRSSSRRQIDPTPVKVRNHPSHPTKKSASQKVGKKLEYQRMDLPTLYEKQRAKKKQLLMKVHDPFKDTPLPHKRQFSKSENLSLNPNVSNILRQRIPLLVRDTRIDFSELGKFVMVEDVGKIRAFMSSEITQIIKYCGVKTLTEFLSHFNEFIHHELHINITTRYVNSQGIIGGRLRFNFVNHSSILATVLSTSAIRSAGIGVASQQSMLQALINFLFTLNELNMLPLKTPFRPMIVRLASLPAKASSVKRKFNSMAPNHTEKLRQPRQFKKKRK